MSAMDSFNPTDSLSYLTAQFFDRYHSLQFNQLWIPGDERCIQFLGCRDRKSIGIRNRIPHLYLSGAHDHLIGNRKILDGK